MDPRRLYAGDEIALKHLSSNARNLLHIALDSLLKERANALRIASEAAQVRRKPPPCAADFELAEVMALQRILTVYQEPSGTPVFRHAQTIET